MKKRPRRKLTLGNMVMRKGRKRVEGVEGKNPNLVGGQRVRQRLRGFWDQRNLDRRQVQAESRRKTGWSDPRTPDQVREKAGFQEARTRYLTARTCERARNRYELRSRYQTHERGERRKAWARKGKYELPVYRASTRTEGLDPGRRTKGGKSGTPKGARGTPKGDGWRTRRTQARGELRDAEAQGLESRYETRRTEARVEFETRLDARKQRRARVPARTQVDHLNTLRARAETTKAGPRQVKNREVGAWVQGDAAAGSVGTPSRSILFAVPTTEYFAKRKNLSRSRDRVARGEAEAEKWRKVPEKARRERRPTWAELDGWMNRRSQGVEDRNRERLLEGKPVSLSEATYVELGKTLVYLYGCERSERWKDKHEDKRALPEDGTGKPGVGSRNRIG